MSDSIKDKENNKQIYNKITHKKEYNDGQLTEYIFDLNIKSYKINDLIIQSLMANSIAKKVSEQFKSKFNNDYGKEISQKQVDFSYDCTNLIFSDLKESGKTILIPAKAGFGKSTLINSILDTIINMNESSFVKSDIKELGLIIVTDRIADLRKWQGDIRKKFGFYDEYKQTDWIFVLEGWNKEDCLNGITKYKEGSCQAKNCSFYNECRVSTQRFEQKNSPILAMSNERFSYYQTDKMDEFRIYNSRNGDIKTREVIIIDEKPKLEKPSDVDVREITKLMIAVDKINVIDPIEDGKNKRFLQSELLNVMGRLNEIQEEYKDYRNAIVLNNEEGLSEKFLEIFSSYFKYQYNNIIQSIVTFFKIGGLYCQSNDMTKFKCIEYARLNIENYRMYIFDATCEGDPSYTRNFVYINIDDYKDYSNLTFHFIDENMSRKAIKERKQKLDVVTKWINETMKEKTYVVSYKECGNIATNHILTKALENNELIILDKDNKNQLCVPYFGNTKGKNKFQDCTNMIQIGWNRFPSDEILSTFLCAHANLEKLKDTWNDKIKRKEIQDRLKFNWINSTFDYSGIQIFEMQKLMVDFEQEVFRTKIRDFNTDDIVNIYVFGRVATITEMISQRFIGCKFGKYEIEEFSLEKNNQNGEDKKEKILYYFLKDVWDGNMISVLELQDKLKIDPNYWSKVIGKKLVKNLFAYKNIKYTKIKGGGRGKYLYIEN